MLDFLFSGVTYENLYWYDISWFMWTKRLAWWTCCSSAYYWGLPLYKGFAVVYLTNPIFLGISSGFVTTLSFIPAMGVAISVVGLLSCIAPSTNPDRMIYAIDGQGVHYLSQKSFNVYVDDYTRAFFNGHLSENDLWRLDTTIEFYSDKIILSDYALFLEVILTP